MTTEHNAQALAYLGDAVLELLFRETLLADSTRKIADVHNTVVTHTSASGQTKLLAAIEPELNEVEKAVVKRGRNATLSRKPRKEPLVVHRRASALEALFGHLYVNGEKARIETLFKAMLEALAEDGS